MRGPARGAGDREDRLAGAVGHARHPGQHGFGVAGRAASGDRLDLSWARRFALWASYAFGQPLPRRSRGWA